jgi:phenylacetaldehyde dehydrogenase
VTSPAVASESRAELPVELRAARMLIGGAWIEAADASTLAVEDPSLAATIAHVPAASAIDVDRAVAAATAAYPAWRALPARTRGAALARIGAQMAEQAEALAEVIAMETGNAIRTQARGEAASAADIFTYFAGAAAEQKGETLPLGDDLLSYSVREPLGVVGAIIPWNAPVQIGALKIAMALCTGNTVVLKAAEDAPLGVLRMAAICAAELPPGVLNVLTGDGPGCGAALLAHRGLSKITFTGSTEVGRIAMRAGADRVLPVSLELGGKSPSIVYPDAAADDATVDGVIAAMRFARQGQSCTAGSRLYVHEDVYDDFVRRLHGRLSALVVGDALDERSDAGALISRRQYERVRSYVGEAAAQGAEVTTLGEDREQVGYQMRPTIVSAVDPDWRIAREEVFGPVLVAAPWRDEDEVLELANRTHYGLAAFVWTRDLDAALRAARRLDAGWIQVNRGGGQLLGMSYGGRRQSGIGAEYSIEGALEGYTTRKSITMSIAPEGSPS